MTLTIDLTLEEEARLQAAARRRGLAAEECVRRLIADLPAATPADKTLELFAQWEAEDATEDPAELAARRAECEGARCQSGGQPRQLPGACAMKPTIVLGSTPLGLLTQRAGSPLADDCRRWLARLRQAACVV